MNSKSSKSSRSVKNFLAVGGLTAAMALAIIGARAQSMGAPQQAVPPPVQPTLPPSAALPTPPPPLPNRQTAPTMAGSAAMGAQTAGATPVKLAPEVFKNIQVLKDLPADQLQPAMQFIAASLGVECSFCHVQGANDKDDKQPKLTARKMMQMTMDINKNSFNGNRGVTCYSCHRGAHDPVGIPVIPDVEAPRPAPNAAPEAAPAPPTADQILSKYLDAVGGADALMKITTRIEKGNILTGGNQVPTEIYAKAPNMRLSVTHNNTDSFTAFDGTAGWMTQRQGPAPMSAAESSNYMIDADFALPLDLQQKKLYKTFRPGRPEKIGDKEYYVLQARQTGLPVLKLYFDEQTGLLARLVRMTDVGLGLMPVQIDYSDYRDADGIKIPFRWTLARVNGRFTTQIDSVQQNVPINDSKFAKPPAPAAAPGQ
jgi:outer membrane lipoprotein-sorting protein